MNLLAPLPSALLGSLLSALLEWLSAHCHWFSTSQPHCWREAAGHNSWKKQQSAKYNSCQARSLHSAISPPICATLRVRFVAAFSEPHLWHSRGLQGGGESARVTRWLLPPTDSGARTLSLLDDQLLRSTSSATGNLMPFSTNGS